MEDSELWSIGPLDGGVGIVGSTDAAEMVDVVAVPDVSPPSAGLVAGAVVDGTGVVTRAAVVEPGAAMG